MKRKNTVTLIILLINVSLSFAQENRIDSLNNIYSNDYPAYVIFDSNGNRVTYNYMLDEISKYQICLFGELHDNPIAHWLELKITEALYESKGDNLVLGAEMWESDSQLMVDELIDKKLIDGKSYSASDVFWPNYKTDYKPLIQFASRKRLKWVCTNIPRRYSTIVYKKGIEYLDSLSPLAKSYLPPLPIHFDLTQPAYAKMVSLFGDDDQVDEGEAPSEMSGYKGTNLVMAQAIKDATMAYHILKYWDESKYFLHYNGCYHSNDYQSIYYYLNYYRPGLDIVTISVTNQADVLNLEEGSNHADFNIIVQEDMTKTY